MNGKHRQCITMQQRLCQFDGLGVLIVIAENRRCHTYSLTIRKYNEI
ncbi:hypothetical protein D1BOALGB6SA_7442 [Olavius sp. associated proteobacterium Delta 1]|nr:hypothetical protein D1BOALGB6SA_7442 [Olavius sp. associated proteobacterium Delta 1]